MNLQQPGTATAPGRTESFNNGVQGTPDSIASSMDAASAMFNSKVPGRFTPHSVLQGIPGMSGNGMSQDDASHKLLDGSMLPSSNAIASGNYDAAMKLRLYGNRSVV